MASLKAICKQRILREMIEHAVQNDSLTLRSPSPSSSLVNYVVLLVDENSLPILSSCCTVYDVLEQGVTVVEPVGKRRQPLPGLDAVYFLAPTIDSVDAVLHDFSDEKTPQYKSVHIFFTSALPPADKLLERFAACPPLLPRIKTFVEFNLDFVVQEQRVFHLGRPLDFIDFYKGGSDPVSRASIDAIATRLFSLCATLGEKPSIRFQKNFRGLSQSVASALHDKLQRSDLFKSSGSETGNVSLLILDRSIDVATLLVHEYTYQALVYDVLEIPTIALPSSSSPLKRGKSGRAPSTSSQEMNELLLQEDTFQYEIVSNAGKREQKRAILGEQDELWVRFRHSHIQSVNEEVQEEIQRFIRENATAKTQKEYQENRRGRATPPATLEAIRALPQYQEMLAKYWMHVSLSEKCFDQLQSQNLMAIGLLEQDLSCGVTKSGKEVTSSKLQQTLISILSDSQFSARVSEKIRLLLLYFTQMNGLSPSDHVKLMEAAELSLMSQKCIEAFLKMNLQPDVLEFDLGQTMKLSHRLELDKERLKYFKKRAKTAAYELSRFEPLVKVIMEKALLGDLHGGNYPFVEETTRLAPSRHSDAAGRKSSSSGFAADAPSIGRSTEWDWSSAWKTSGTGGASLPSSTSPSAGASRALSSFSPLHDRSKKRLIVFILGGITHAEMRSAYEVSKDLHADVFLGGSCILTPPEIIKLLRASLVSLSKKEKEEDEEEEEEEPA